MKNLPALSLRSMLFALPLTLFGCEQGQMPPYPSSTQQAAPTLATDARFHAPNAPVTVRLTNVTPRFIRYDLCRSSLERFHDGDWNVVQPMLAQACTAELRGLAPGRIAAFSFRVANPTRTQYRVRTEIEDTATRARSEVASNPFAMTPERPDSD